MIWCAPAIESASADTDKIGGLLPQKRPTLSRPWAALRNALSIPNMTSDPALCIFSSIRNSIAENRNCEAIMSVCRVCNGTGQTAICRSCKGRGRVICRQCSGEGRIVIAPVSDREVAVHSSASVTDICLTCHGSGNVVCSRCDGSGKTTIDKCYACNGTGTQSPSLFRMNPNQQCYVAYISASSFSW